MTRAIVIATILLVLLAFFALTYELANKVNPDSSTSRVLRPVVEETTTSTTVATTTTSTTQRPRVKAYALGPSTGRCGGDLPPCWVMMRESRGNIHAYNPTGCGGRGCRGKWQCDPRTCSGTGTEAEQDAEARRLWANGAGCAHWAAC